jgi:hypothetical protein
MYDKIRAVRVHTIHGFGKISRAGDPTRERRGKRCHELTRNPVRETLMSRMLRKIEYRQELGSCMNNVTCAG